MTGKDEQDVEQSEGQVSEVASMDPAAADTPISDDQAVAGNPEAEGAIEDGEDAGPNGKAGGNVESNRSA
ncbi:hypothetical protein GHK92_08020 [Nocardioides sp. dk4132]|uniref:hypothetical protein n=1 Tax=unclassified Nocardioides TaxID=2615069 RepID=UPI001295963D|nr:MULTISPECIES: hypothetical protein [unclassified Nocardioides]MQW75817.1 hypothetical protein [Nocardioides sp. dk4132]QGA08691.1 hypothetical protein GFH29_15780 [Nocardioides sp. dk884]